MVSFSLVKEIGTGHPARVFPNEMPIIRSVFTAWDDLL